MLPQTELPAWSEPAVNLAAHARRGSLILCVYSGIAKWTDGVELNKARAHAWRKHELRLLGLGYDTIALSAQSLEDQRAWIEDDGQLGTVLSDVELTLAATLGLSTIELADRRVYDDLTLIAHEGEVTQVFHPLPDLINDTHVVTTWLSDVHDA